MSSAQSTTVISEPLSVVSVMVFPLIDLTVPTARDFLGAFDSSGVRLLGSANSAGVDQAAREHREKSEK